MRMRGFILCFVLAVLLIACRSNGYAALPSAPQKVDSLSPLWGDLIAGPYRVGFRREFKFDSSRTWLRTRDYKGVFTPDVHGRPVQINVWYPATANGSTRQMRFGDYVDQSAPEAFSKLNSTMRERNRQNAESSVPGDRRSALLSMAMHAYADALYAQGRFPVVLYFGGLDSEINSNVVLAEYMASHGYVFVSISLLGPTDEQTFQSRTRDDMEASVRDMEFAWSTIVEAADVDKTKLAVIGHSVGGIEAVLFGMRNTNVSAAVALDGTYGFPGLSKVLTEAYGYAPEKLHAAFLDLRRAQGAQGNEPLDLAAVESFRYSDRTLITLEKMHHSDFTSFAMVGKKFHTPITATYPLNGWNRETAKVGHEQMCRIILAFFEDKVKGHRKADAELAAVVHRANGTIKHEAAALSPPSPLEMAALVSREDLEAAKMLLSKICGEQNVATCVDGDRFNTFGYNLLGQHRAKDALALFQLAAWAHSGSANAQDSLADGYLSVGDKESAKASLKRSIELVPADPSIDSASKASFMANENQRLQELN